MIPDPWREVTMAIPAEARLFSKGMIMAGTLSGMIEPFWGYGIVGALISGAIAAKAVTDREERYGISERFTAGFTRKIRAAGAFRGQKLILRGALLTRAGILAMRIKVRT